MAKHPGDVANRFDALSTADNERTRIASERVATQSDAAILAESRRLGPIVSDIVNTVADTLIEGATTAEIAAHLVRASLSHGLEPAMLGYNGYPAAAAISVNDELLHGIPSHRQIRGGDLVKVEFGVVSGTAFASRSWTFSVGDPTQPDRQLMDVGERALREAVNAVSPSNRLGDIGGAVQTVAGLANAVVIREYIGYGMGRKRIQGPPIHGTGTSKQGARMQRGSILNLHVILKRGTPELRIEDNGWTASSVDGQRGVLFTSMVEVTADGSRILTPLH